jgi:transcription antitermination factor NusG
MTEVRITEDGPFFGQIATVIDLNPVHGSSQVWLDVDGVKVVVAFHEVEPV